MRYLALLLLTVAVANASVSVTRTSNDAPHPSTMELEVTLPDSNSKVLIPLERTDAFENIPMTLIGNGVSRTFSSHQVHHSSHAHYRNITSKSVISVRHLNGKKLISGHVMHEGTSYFLEPIGENEHQVVKNVRTPEVVARDIQSRRKRQSNTSPTTNKVEIHLLLDSTVWNGFITVFGSESVVLTELHFYYTHMLNGLDVAYRNMGTPSISVSCIGLTISKTSSDDAWLPPGVLEGSEILNKMADYIKGKTADHFMAFTRLDIAQKGNSAVSGMAPFGGTCTPMKVSINEDGGLHTWGTAAHELGHNLGAKHDGEDNDCEVVQQNIMAESSHPYTVENIGNAYQFSSCSKDSIRKYIDSLTASNTNCLVSDQGTRLSELTSDVRQGARLTLDQVCKLADLKKYKEGKFEIPESASPASICAFIRCKSINGLYCQSGSLRAPVGTPCGNKKSCDWKGQCSADASAPAADENCFWGDTWSASNCADWKHQIVVLKNTGCTADVKKGCCKTLGSLVECSKVGIEISRVPV